MDTELHLLETEESMQKAVEHMVQEFASVRTGKASPALVENIDIYVASYASSMKLKQLAVITTPEARLIAIQPFDQTNTRDIEKGIRESRLGINPSVNGRHILLPIPELNKERRVELTKMVKTMAEDGKVRVRSVRREALEACKKAEKDSAITEDDLHRMEKEVQELTDKSVREIDALVSKKEAEIMAV